MAHFAQLSPNNVVLQVIVVDNSLLLDSNGIEHEDWGVTFCRRLFGGVWVQTSYNGTIRKNFAGVGYIYDVPRDAFVAPRPEGAGWVLDEATCVWINPDFENAQQNVSMGVTRV